MRSAVKIICAFLVSAVLAGLCGCLVYIPQDDDEAIRADAEKLVQSLLRAVEDGDSEAFDALFADHVLTLADFERGKNYVFDMYQGNLQSLEYRYHHTGARYSSRIESFKYAVVDFSSVVTDKNEYVVYIDYYTEHENECNVNKIVKFKIVEKAVFEESGTYTDMSLRYGIYYPGWEET